jgi:hypothetical protein
MIQANELRIGSKVMYRGSILTVQTAGRAVRLEETGLSYSNEWLDPIPLTSEILAATGFTYTASFGECRYTKEDVQMDEHFNPLVQDGNEYLYFGVTTKSVHQLQNLYFALTGNELDVSKITAPSHTY